MTATNKRGVFSLEKVLERQSDNNWSNIFDPFRYIQTNNFGSDYGYSLGGYYPNAAPGNGSTYVQRIDLTNDTATGLSRGNLSSQRSAHGAASSLTAMYTANGQNYGVQMQTTIVDRLDYASDTLTATRKGDLSNERYGTSGISNTDYGFWVGGTPGPAITYRTDWANDSASPIPSANWYPGSSSPYFGAAAGNQSYGYAFAGSGGGTHTGRIDYSNHTATMLEKGKGTYSGYGFAGTGNANYGYYAGGPGPKSSVSRLDYANDNTAATPKGPLDTGKLCAGATATPSYGYWIGGADGGWGSPGTTSSQRLDFSNDTATTSPKGPLAAGVSYNSGTSTKAFGFPTPAIGNATRTETGLIPVGNYGYFTGGTPGPKSTTFRIDFDSDTSAALTKGPLSVARYSNNAFAGGSFAGHMAGGYDGGNPGRTSTHDRLDYANDTNAMESKANLNWETTGAAATGNTEKGYWWGGRNNAYSPNYLTYVDRITYANSTVTEMPRSTTQGNGRAAAGNANYGWWSGAQQTLDPGYMKTWVYRLDYSNDTAAPTPKGGILSQGYGHSASGNSDYGWHVGGSDGVPSRFTYVSRIDYSNDTVTASSRANTTVVHNHGGSTGNSSYGYFNAGTGGPTITARIDYSNDTTTPLIRNILPSSHNYRAGTSPLINGFSTIALGSKTVDKGADGYSISTPTDAANHGYFAGGYDYAEPSAPSADMTLIQRIDFTNDTATALLKGNLSSSPGVHKSTSSNGSYGYIVGGNIVPSVTRVDRLDYTNDTATTSIRGPITGPVRGALAGAGNNDYGWHTGGIYAIPSRTVYSKVDRIDYSNDSSTASPKGNLAAARGYHNSTGTLNYGYFAAGTPDGQFGPNSSTVQRIDYGNDTAISSPKGPLSRGTSQHASTGNANYGWFIGGYGPNSRSKIDRIDYASDTAVASVRGPLYQPSYRLDGTGNSNYGYVHPGLYPGNPAGPGGSTEIARIDYSNDTITTGIRGHFARSMRIQESAFSAAENGRNPVITSYTSRVRWVDSAPEATAGPAFGYFGGGREEGGPSPGNKSVVDRIDFSNDTAAAVTKGPLTANKYSLSATGNKSHGYYGGGRSYESLMDRIDYSNDSGAAAPKGQLSIGRYRHAAVGDASFGYFAGGQNGPIFSSVDRVDYGNDTVTTSPKGTLSFARSNLAGGGTGNTSFGYIGAGGPGNRSSVDRIDYSNDTATAAVKGPLSRSNEKLAATGNANFGYFAGGGPFPAEKTTIDRIDYSNDTATAVEKGPLAAAMYWSAGTGSPSFGYFGGGGYPAISTVQRIDYGNDTATAVVKGSLSNFKYGHGATSALAKGFPSVPIAAPVQPPFPYPVQLPIPAANYGYIMGGQGDPSAPNANSLPAQRIDFFNDTATAAVRAAPGAYYNYYANATGNKNYAWSSMGGFGSSCSVLRLDYSNDTATMLSRGQRATPLVGASGPTPSVGGYEECAVGNLDYGYWCGGGKNYSVPANPSTCSNGYIQGFSHIDRLDYSNDTANTLRRSYNTTRTGSGDGCGTNTYGYFVGGGDNQCNAGDTSTVIERLDYSADTNNSISKGNLTNAVWRNSTVGNNEYGYSVGGSPGSNSTYVQRIDYANDTATTAPKGNLSVTRSSPPSTGSQSHGYVTGGSGSDVYTSVERITYANDTATASPKGNLTYKTYYSGGASAAENSNHL